MMRKLGRHEVQRSADRFANGIAVVKVGPGHQVVVRPSYPGTTPASVGEEGKYLMRLEDHLRDELGQPIELYVEPRPDENKLRQRRENVIDWVERRGMLKHQAEEKHAPRQS